MIFKLAVLFVYYPNLFMGFQTNEQKYIKQPELVFQKLHVYVYVLNVLVAVP